jgi:hypothetical protein
MFEGVPTGDVIDEECPGSTAVVGAGDGTEGFLAGCVPYLKLNISYNSFVVYSDCVMMICCMLLNIVQIMIMPGRRE